MSRTQFQRDVVAPGYSNHDSRQARTSSEVDDLLRVVVNKMIQTFTNVQTAPDVLMDLFWTPPPRSEVHSAVLMDEQVAKAPQFLNHHDAPHPQFRSNRAVVMYTAVGF